ncbi:MAG TPA: polysaccharide deacetylase family protein [Acidobacteriaceae bacterium]|nr:polysaccharide deacetylase family protein [Acidobacteriaceae bacterium]
MLFLLYHELRDGDSRYTYAASSNLFRRHLELYTAARADPALIWPEVTFDDGHISNHTIAAPLLAFYGIKAHFFITSGWTGIKPGYMGWAELRDLGQAGHVIGAHGWSHALLTHCNDRELEMELVQSRRTLEDKLGVPVTTMSLPGGRANARVFAACARAGYSRVFTSIPHAEASLSPHPGRLNILGEMQPEWLEKLLDPGTGILASLERKQRIKDAAKSLLGDRLYEKLWAVVNRHEPEDITA